MTNADLIERITRSLAYMLRHQPEEFDLELDAHGFGELDDVVRALSERLGEDIEVEDVEEAITSGDRPRYEIEDDRVRALYGHSIDVDPGEPTQPPDLLYVGINGRDARRAVQYGLRGGRRRFLHLARTLEDARETGRRTGVEYSVLTVHALDAWEDGVNFYDRQALFLAEQIPTEFLELAESRDDGFEREPRGRERSRGGRRGGREGREGRGRGRGGRGRDRDDRPRSDRDRDDRPRSDRDRDDRPRSDRDRDERPRGDRGDRDERRPRRDRERSEGDRGGRERPERGRSERDSGRSRGPRSSERGGAEPRREPAPAKPSAREPEPAPSEGFGGGFGEGIFEAAPKPKPRREPAPAKPERKPEPKPEPKAQPEPEPVDDFGLGL